MGGEAAPRGGVAGHVYVRAPKVARATFAYYIPLPQILSVFWCEACQAGRACLVNGRCAGGVRPEESQAALRGVGRLTLAIQNPPAGLKFDVGTGVITGGGAVSASLGETAVAELERVTSPSSTRHP